MLKQYYIGDIHPSDLKPENGSKDPSKHDTCKSCWSYWILPIIGAVLLGFLYRYYTSESKSSWGGLAEVGKCIHFGVKTRDLLGGCRSALSLNPASCILPPWSQDDWPDIHLRSGTSVLHLSEPYSQSTCSLFCVKWLPVFPLFTGFHEYPYISKLPVHKL